VWVERVIHFDKWDFQMVDATHGLNKKSDNSPSAIIIKFVRRLDKFEFIEKRKAARNLSTEDFGFQSENRIFVND
jgi:hypothetical protein